MQRLEILWAVCPEVVIVGGVLGVLTGAFAMLAAYTLVCPAGEGDVYDA